MDPLTIGMFALLAVLVFFTWRNSRKRKAAAEEQKAQLQPGVELMTNFGVYGTLKSIDTVANIAEIEIAKNTVIKVHPGAIAKVISADADSDEPRSVEEAMARATAEQEAREAELNVDHAIPAGEPEFGERVEPVKKPARKAPAKKTAE
jgi:preprotein translocase subunit YajC